MTVPVLQPLGYKRFPELTRRDFLKVARAGLGALLFSGLATESAGESLLPGPLGQSAFFGVVADLLTGRPIAGAIIRAEPSGPATTSDLHGAYRLELPPGVHTVGARHPAYHDLTMFEQMLGPGQARVANFDLVRRSLTPPEEEAVYAKLGLQMESPLPDPQVMADSQVQALALPTTIVVRTHSLCGYADSPVPLEDYVKGVVPNEVPYTWRAEALKAQAVAARSYGVVTFLAQGYVYDDARSQVYNPANRQAQTDAAVDATRGVVATYGGSIAQTFFFSRCNGVTTRNSEQAIDWRACAVKGWSYVAYCRARSCGGHGPYNNGCTGETYGYYGHGVGMCQWGAWARANEGLSYQAILQRYYMDVAVQAVSASAPLALLYPADGAVTSPGPTTLAWSGAGERYNVQVDGLESYTTASTVQRVYVGSPGTYSWRVQAVGADGTLGPWSPERTFEVAAASYRIYLPLLCRP